MMANFSENLKMTFSLVLPVAYLDCAFRLILPAQTHTYTHCI